MLKFIILKHKFKMTANCCVSNFLQRIVDGVNGGSGPIGSLFPARYLC